MIADAARREVPLRSISAVVPVYNEAANISSVVGRTMEALHDVVPDFELILVDDGSTDATPRLVDELAAQYPRVRVIHHAKHQGYGSAWRSGIDAATKQYIFLMLADRQFDPADIARLAQWNDRYDAVVGYPSRREDPFYRRAIGWCFRLLVRVLFGLKLHDVNSSFKLFRASVLKNMDLRSRGVLINTEIHFRVRQQNLRLREVAVHRYPRRARQRFGARLGVMLRGVGELAALRRRFGRERRAARKSTSPPPQTVDAAKDPPSPER